MHTGVNIDGQIDGLSADNEGSYTVSAMDGGKKPNIVHYIIINLY